MGVLAGGAVVVAEEDPAYRFGYLFGSMLCPLTVGAVTIGIIAWALWYYKRR